MKVAAAWSSTHTPFSLSFQGDLLKPSMVNTPVFRVVALAASVLAGAKSGSVLGPRGLAFLHLSTYAVSLGTLTWVTFIAGKAGNGQGASSGWA